jgi:hypothetical protein
MDYEVGRRTIESRICLSAELVPKYHLIKESSRRSSTTTVTTDEGMRTAKPRPKRTAQALLIFRSCRSRKNERDVNNKDAQKAAFATITNSIQ